MNPPKRRNSAASVRQRLLNIARKQQEELQFVLSQYARERLLFRLSQSPHRDQFVLKGAMLFQLWSGQPHRSTRDLDLLGQGEPSLQRFERMLQEVCQQAVEDDGLAFRAETVRAEQIKEDDEYQGLRLRLEARLGNARIPVQIDIGFGDAVTPAPEEITFPAILDFPAPTIRAYPRETVVAEKFQAMVMLGIANSRMKDFYDLWTLARQFEFRGQELCAAIGATFERRRTPLPIEQPLALTTEFSEDATKRTQWQAFVRKGKLAGVGIPLAEVTVALAGFLLPPTNALVRRVNFNATWSPPGPWKN